MAVKNYQQPGGTSNPEYNPQIGIRPLQAGNPMVTTGNELSTYQQPMTDKEDPQGTVRGHKD